MKKKSTKSSLKKSPGILIGVIFLIVVTFFIGKTYQQNLNSAPQTNVLIGDEYEDTTYGFQVRFPKGDLYWQVIRYDEIEVRFGGSYEIWDHSFSIEPIDHHADSYVDLTSEEVENSLYKDGNLMSLKGDWFGCEDETTADSYCVDWLSKSTYREINGKNRAFLFETTNVSSGELQGDEDGSFIQNFLIRLPRGKYLRLYRDGPMGKKDEFDLTQWAQHIKESDISTGLILGYNFSPGVYTIYHADKKTPAALVHKTDRTAFGFRINLPSGKYFLKAEGQWKDINVKVGKLTMIRADQN